MNEKITLGKWSPASIHELLVEASKIDDTGMRIAFLSRPFLGTPYGESTLVGGPATPEELVVNLSALDCFTFIDYIEAMRMASTFEQFLEALKRIRYREGTVSYTDRNHFFTDWREHNGLFVSDVTSLLGKGRVRRASKTLNLRSDGSPFLEGLPFRMRSVEYIPSAMIDGDVLGELHNGDYAGIFTDIDGLDVSHVGIVIKEKGQIYLRHASSAAAFRRVVDQLFGNYVREKPGIVILRPLPEQTPH
jgi:hypothetical protein